MLVNATLELAPHDPYFGPIFSVVLPSMEQFFLKSIRAGQADGRIAELVTAEELARHLLGVLTGVRTLTRVRPERGLLEGVVAPALALLDGVQPRSR